MQEEADILQLKRSSNGVLIAVGLPVDAKIFFQEYWSNRTPHYLIANTSVEPATITIAEWKGANGRFLLGPWTIPSKAVKDYNIESLPTDNSSALLTISLNDDPVYGLLKSPMPPALPLDQHSKDILTSYGLNGIGDRHANLLCFQKALAFDPGQVIPLMLRVPERVGVISFKAVTKLTQLPQAIVVGAESKSLSVEGQVGDFIVGARQDQSPGFHEIRLEVKLPEVGAETMTALWGHVASPSGAGYSFGRGLVVQGDR